MNRPNDEFDGLGDVAERLRSERTQASDLQLDQIKRRVLHKALAPRSSMKGRFMYSRLGITAMLVAGLLMALSGAALADGAFDGDGSASVSQYGDGDGDGAAVGDGVGGVGAEDVRAEEQVTAAEGEGDLPLTGFLAIPLIVIGACLVVTGTILRRRLPRGP